MDEMIEQVNPVHVTLDDLEELIGALSAEEIEELAECDPDDSNMPPSMRCAYKCNKAATGEVNRDKLLDGLKEQALAIPDKII
ncbi:tropomodulin-like [Eurytemora carolleeae]|uniref:tropomodulin-like n=1 Tax=Eurytemora carolleeae TaxID=1294199 RepID=UPI000C774932|nr:tropomodulin-like [Eurytemora carolleeae]|eukprot:XP_023342621.1 tropomodulin-like [Eurytemora affinis]